MKISLMLNSFSQELEPAIETAANLGIDAVQIPLTLQDGKAFRLSLMKVVHRFGSFPARNQLERIRNLAVTA